MKKKFVTGLLMCAIVGTMLTGCGDNKEVTKVDESTVVITEITESTEESTETEEVTDQLESETETVEAETEEVAEDFLSKNGITITPQGSMTMLLTPSTAPDTDDVEEMDADVYVATIILDEEGRAVTEAKFDVTMNSALSYWVTAFDRYTGTCFESGLQSFETNENATRHDDVCVIDVDGKQYDCSLEVTQGGHDSVSEVTVKVYHPSDYDGVVIQFGKFGLAQDAEYENIDYSTAFTVDQYPALLEGQYFFTATDK